MQNTAVWNERFAVLNKLIRRDMNKNPKAPTFVRYTKDEIKTYLENPYRYQTQIRDAINYIYGASSHFRRLIQYFTGLSDCCYVVSPYRIDPTSAKPKTIQKNYRKVLSAMSSMNIPTQLPKILNVCLREDVFYGTLWVTNDNITIQQLPSEACVISTVEGNVPNVTFDFSYFNANSAYLPFYPAEFTAKYNLYQKDRQNMRYQELDCPNSFAIKCSSDIMEYPLPPFVGVLREVYDLEDYKALLMTKTEMENYAMLVMTIGLTEDGDWQIDLPKAKEFYDNLAAVLPEEFGSAMTPFPLSKISFERTNSSDKNTVADAEQNLFSAAGVSSLLFNNVKASGNALLLSIKADQSLTYGIVRSVEDAINRFIQAQGYGKNFKVTFLDVSPFNRKEAGDTYLKACQYGMPMITYYAASQGLGQAEMECMNFLENDILGLTEKFRPLMSSSTMSGSGEPGAPRKDIGDLGESGEIHREEE